MGEYLVLARKYRSATFEEVVAQEPIAQTLKNAIASGRVAHAYLFTGSRGIGKTTMARILAKALNCLASDAPTAQPCNRCEACQAIARGEDIDVVEIDGASNRGIDEVRQLRANVILRPARCRYKIYYIDEVHMLTKEAFNALLKTLEEPPQHVKFIFSTTEAEKVPPTIVSRCQRFDFRNISTRQIAGHLASICKAEKVKVDEEAIFRIARWAAGSMRDALSLLDQLLAGTQQVTDQEVVRILGLPPEERILAMVRAVADGKAGEALGQLKCVLEGGFELGRVIEALGECFRNMMVAATCGPDSALIELPDSLKRELGELAKRFSAPALVQAVAICQNLDRATRDSSLDRALVEAALVRLAEAEKFVDPASLLERLESLAHPPGAAGQKKNPPLSELAAVSPPRHAAGQYASEAVAQPAAVQDAPQPAIQWQEDWLKANWQQVIDSLAARRQMQVAGALRAAKVLAFEGGTLKLGFDGSHESLLRQCQDRLGMLIAPALSELAGKSITCQYVSTGSNAGGEKAQPTGMATALSAADKSQIMKDPAIQAVLNLFGGEVVDMRKDTPMIGPAEQDA